MQNRAFLPLITMGDYMYDLWRDIERVKQSETLSYLNRGLIYTLRTHGFVFQSRPYRSIVREKQNRASVPLITTGDYMWRERLSALNPLQDPCLEACWVHRVCIQDLFDVPLESGDDL